MNHIVVDVYESHKVPFPEVCGKLENFVDTTESIPYEEEEQIFDRQFPALLMTISSRYGRNAKTQIMTKQIELFPTSQDSS